MKVGRVWRQARAHALEGFKGGRDSATGCVLLKNFSVQKGEEGGKLDAERELRGLNGWDMGDGAAKRPQESEGWRDVLPGRYQEG